MKVTMNEGAVPFVLTFRKILQKPKLKRERRFVGPTQLIKNLLVKAIDAIEEAAFETKTEVIDPGRTVAVHWAVSLEDPWDVTGGEANLVAYRMDGDRPPCGAHFEIISPNKAPKQRERVEDEIPVELSPEQFDRLVAAQQAHAHQHAHQLNNRTSGPVWRRPADPAYAPRPISPLDPGAAAEEASDEDFEGVDWSGQVGEVD